MVQAKRMFVFSVQSGLPFLLSLRNIYKELALDMVLRLYRP